MVAENETRTFEFENEYGEPFKLVVNLTEQTAVLSSSEFEPTEIIGDRIQNRDLILAQDEEAKLNEIWMELFGRELKPTPLAGQLRGPGLRWYAAWIPGAWPFSVSWVSSAAPISRSISLMASPGTGTLSLSARPTKRCSLMFSRT